MSAKAWVEGGLAIATVFAFAQICNQKRFSVVRSGDYGIQRVMTEANQEIDKGRYEKIIIFHGKNPFLVSS